MRQATLPWAQSGTASRCSDDVAGVNEAGPSHNDKAQSLFPLFDTPPTSSSSESQTRPLRTVRSKRPLSYREDLKAVLKADAEHEAALLPQSSATPKRTPKNKARLSDQNNDDQGFHIVSQTRAPEPKPEPKPLSLAVKGFGTVTDGQAHPFFAKKSPKPPPPPPIAVRDDSPTPEPNRPPTAFKSLFSALRRPPADGPRLKPSVAPWPSALDTHVVPPEDAAVERLKTDLPAFRARWPKSHTSIGYDAPDPPSDFIRRMNTARPSASTSSTSVSGRASAPTSEPDTAQRRAAQHQLWTDVWRPHAAQQCLGNEARAAYLADWLRRLLVAAPGSVVDKKNDHKRKKGKVPSVTIQRRVDKKRRRRADSDSEDEMADFIVDDDDDLDEIEDDDAEAAGGGGSFDKFRRIGTDDESEGGGEVVGGATTSQDSRPASSADLGRLTNCIVLCGASGTGKTAAVYACASELGFEVFELYPGMGKRSGKEMLDAVGDLGRNHMVSSGGSGGGATWKQFPFRPTTAAAAVASAPTVRQSLILIEEADVLFEEDKGFWSAVVELVAESKRPVVITCNDLDLVPTHDLPIQQILQFQAPTVSTVVPYLRDIAATRAVKDDELQALLEQPRKSQDDNDKAQVDLRQAIAQLQFGSYVNPSVRVEQQLDVTRFAHPDVRALKALAKATDVVSCADVLALKPEMEAHGDRGVEQQASVRQLGATWRQLVPQPLATPASTSCFTDDVAKALLAVVPTQPASELHTGLNAKRAQHMDAVDTTLSVVRTAHTSKRDLVLDYAPIIRIMGAVDDDLYHIHESLRAQHQPLNGRSTRNSVRSYLGLPLDDSVVTVSGIGYVRWLPFGLRETRAVRQSALLWQ